LEVRAFDRRLREELPQRALRRLCPCSMVFLSERCSSYYDLGGKSFLPPRTLRFTKEFLVFLRVL